MLAVAASAPELIDAWFRLGFGCQAVWAIRRVALPQPTAFAGTVRSATLDDLEDVVDLDEILFEHQAGSPSFSGLTAPSREELRAEEIELWDDDATAGIFAAELDGRVVGLVVLYRRPEGELRVPPGNIDLALRGDAPRRARARRRARPDGARPRLGSRARPSNDDDRLAHREPALVAVLAPPRLPAAVPPPLPRGAMIGAT